MRENYIIRLNFLSVIKISDSVEDSTITNRRTPMFILNFELLLLLGMKLCHELIKNS